MFTAQFTEHILNKLTAHRRLVQVGVSVAVLGDFVRNCYTVSQLAQERFKVGSDIAITYFREPTHLLISLNFLTIFEFIQSAGNRTRRARRNSSYRYNIL